MFNRIWPIAFMFLAHILSSKANDEFDNLAHEFQNGFGLASKKMGITGDLHGPPKNIVEAEKLMRDLYTALERNLMDARQRAANARSSMTSSAIEQLKLV